MSVPEYPLHWPDSMARTTKKANSQFKTSLTKALGNVRDSLQRFSNDTGKKLDELSISSNVTLGNQRPTDTGVAVWFIWDGMQVCIAVDRYPKVEDNLQAIHHVIEARRTEMRHGGIEIVRATFKGFQALPAPGKRPWRAVLGIAPDVSVTMDMLKHFYRSAAKVAHPDSGGSASAMQEVNAAYQEAKKEIGA